jgi:PhnB protein
VVRRQRPQAPFGGRIRTIGDDDAVASVAAKYIHIEPAAKAEAIMSEQVKQRAATGEGYSIDTGLARPGAITYLHMPATDVRRAAVFYRDAYIYVADIKQTVALIVAHGGAVLTEPYPEGLLTVATFRDPAGNVIGLWHDTTRPSRTAEQTGCPAAERTVTPVPEHLHTVTPRLALTDAAAAMDFYAEAFDAREVGERHCAPDGTLIHAELRIGDSIVMVTEDEGYTALLCTYWPDVDAAWERATAAGAQVMHPLADQFYGERGGRLRYPFDQEWTLSARLEKLTAAEIAARAAHD